MPLVEQEKFNVISNNPFGIQPVVAATNKAPTSGPGNSVLQRLTSTGLTAVAGITSGVTKGISSLFGGFGSGGTGSPNIRVVTLPSSNTQDWRVKISVNKGSGVLYDAPEPGLLAPLLATNGVIFPYTPSITISHTARYSAQPLTHTNYNNYFYEGSEVQGITINADFTVQNGNEAAYFLAALYFFRAATKMFYGDSERYKGAPPPIVYLDGYGSHYLPHVSCVVTGFTHTMPNDVDYVETTVGIGSRGTAQNPATPVSNSLPGMQGGNGVLAPQPGSPSDSNIKNSGFFSTRVPTHSQFQITLQPVYSRTAQRAFNYDAFARGELIVGQNRTTGYL